MPPIACNTSASNRESCGDILIISPWDIRMGKVLPSTTPWELVVCAGLGRKCSSVTIGIDIIHTMWPLGNNVPEWAEIHIKARPMKRMQLQPWPSHRIQAWLMYENAGQPLADRQADAISWCETMHGMVARWPFIAYDSRRRAHDDRRLQWVRAVHRKGQKFELVRCRHDARIWVKIAAEHWRLIWACQKCRSTEPRTGICNEAAEFLNKNWGSCLEVVSHSYGNIWVPIGTYTLPSGTLCIFDFSDILFTLQCKQRIDYWIIQYADQVER